MSDLQKTGTDALAKAPKSLQQRLYGLGMQFKNEDGPVSPMAGGLGPGAEGMIAGVAKGSPNTVSVMQPDRFTKNAPQLVTHEGVHELQNNWPPAIQNAIPPDNPNDPNNYGGTARIAQLIKSGGTIANLPREQAAAAMQYGQVHGMPEPYKSLDATINSIPLSQIDMTDPSAKEINTHPRAPLPPIMNYATDTYKKGEPAPGDDPYAAFVQTGTVGGHAPDDSPVGVTQGVSNPSAAPAETDPYASYAGAAQNPDEPYDMQLLKSIPTALKSAGKGILEGAGGTLNNLRQLGFGPKGTPEEEQQLKSLITPSGDENDVAAQRFGKGVEQAGEFLIPGMGEEAAVSKLGKLAPLGKLAYNALTTGAMNKAQGGDFSTGAIAGGLGSVGGQLLEHAAPAVAEQALGIRGRVDRAFNKEPGRAVLDEIKGVRPDTIAENARTRIADLSSQTEDIANQAGANGVTASLTPSRDIVKDAMGKFSGGRQNAAGTSGQLGDMGKFLSNEFDTGNAIPSDVSPARLLDLRRGFNEEFGQWNPERKDATINTGRRAYSALSNELHNTLPDIAPLDARISNLIPVKNRAQVKALGDDTTARVLSRIARPTGALAGLGTGAYVGGKEGGTAGAIEGGLLGLVLPELMSSPTGQMVTARTLNRAGALRPLVGAGLQFDRRPPQ